MCYNKLVYIKKKYKSCLYFLIVFILNKNFLLINKTNNTIEFIVNKRKKIFKRIKNYLKTAHLSGR